MQKSSFCLKRNFIVFNNAGTVSSSFQKLILLCIIVLVANGIFMNLYWHFRTSPFPRGKWMPGDQSFAEYSEMERIYYTLVEDYPFHCRGHDYNVESTFVDLGRNFDSWGKNMRFDSNTQTMTSAGLDGVWGLNSKTGANDDIVFSYPGAGRISSGKLSKDKLSAILTFRTELSDEMISSIDFEIAPQSDNNKIVSKSFLSPDNRFTVKVTFQSPVVFRPKKLRLVETFFLRVNGIILGMDYE